MVYCIGKASSIAVTSSSSKRKVYEGSEPIILEAKTIDKVYLASKGWWV